ncbi:hypothetical protein MPLDJ20_20069 [Mesorhizobium plurifarium]|uniref:Uncharacterized protein n=1 Tax=Mesorhizobium plurifarium TaxID=69974 RepID=A0A090EU25_MESPL|nr:hypothetical protein MPLDJ20_20069 [Mesorhizobium plurifarium]CDX38528.1 hypothetical protein MPLSOD_330060 [Mesorhizobium sp. SOD10]
MRHQSTARMAFIQSINFTDFFESCIHVIRHQLKLGATYKPGPGKNGSEKVPIQSRSKAGMHHMALPFH